MTNGVQYLIGLVLMLAVALVYSMARKDSAKGIVKETAVVFIYMLGAVAGVVIIVLLATKL